MWNSGYSVSVLSFLCVVCSLAAALAVTGLGAFASDGAAVDPLVRQLGSDDFETREAACKGLKALGESAVPALVKAEESENAEVQRRAAELVDAIEAPLAAKAHEAIRAL